MTCHLTGRKRDRKRTRKKKRRGEACSSYPQAVLCHKKTIKKQTQRNGPKPAWKKKQIQHVVQYLEDLLTVCSNIAPWLLGMSEEQCGSETDSEISVRSQHSVYPSVCLSVYLTVKLSLSANTSP